MWEIEFACASALILDIQEVQLREIVEHSFKIGLKIILMLRVVRVKGDTRVLASFCLYCRFESIPARRSVG